MFKEYLSGKTVNIFTEFLDSEEKYFLCKNDVNVYPNDETYRIHYVLANPDFLSNEQKKLCVGDITMTSAKNMLTKHMIFESDYMDHKISDWTYAKAPNVSIFTYYFFYRLIKYFKENNITPSYNTLYEFPEFIGLRAQTKYDRMYLGYEYGDEYGQTTDFPIIGFICVEPGYMSVYNKVEEITNIVKLK